MRSKATHGVDTAAASPNIPMIPIAPSERNNRSVALWIRPWRHNMRTAANAAVVRAEPQAIHHNPNVAIRDVAKTATRMRNTPARTGSVRFCDGGQINPTTNNGLNAMMSAPVRCGSANTVPNMIEAASPKSTVAPTSAAVFQSQPDTAKTRNKKNSAATEAVIPASRDNDETRVGVDGVDSDSFMPPPGG